MIQQLYTKKITLFNNFKIKINIFLDTLKLHYNLSNNIKDIEKSLLYVNKLCEAHVTQSISVVENGALILHLLQIINTNLLTIINSTIITTINSTTSFAIINAKNYKNYTAQYQQLIKSIADIDTELHILVANELYIQYFTHCEEYQINDNFIEFSNIFKLHTYVFAIYVMVTKQLLTKYQTNIIVYNSIQTTNEQIKDFVLAQATNNLHTSKIPIANYSTFIANNPYLKTFGLVPVSNVMSLTDITKVLFSNAYHDLQKTCAEKKYDLIIIQKYLNRGINYSVLNLLDYTKSAEFKLQHDIDDGITLDMIKRFSSIEYLAPVKHSVDFKINYNYALQNDTNLFVCIIEEIYPGQYHILSNVISTNITYFVRKSIVQEFINFVTSKFAPRSRIENYNTIINKGIAQNMFSGSQRDIRYLEEKSSSYDPKELRFAIYTAIINKYEQLNTKPLKNIFAFSKLLHNIEFITIFENIITSEYNILLQKNMHTYKNNNIILSEVYTSFIYDLNIYERDFKKKIHDAFISKVVTITSETFDNITLARTFNNIVKDVLNDVISNEKNVFQSLNYKLYLLQSN